MKKFRLLGRTDNTIYWVPVCKVETLHTFLPNTSFTFCSSQTFWHLFWFSGTLCFLMCWSWDECLSLLTLAHPWVVLTPISQKMQLTSRERGCLLKSSKKVMEVPALQATHGCQGIHFSCLWFINTERWVGKTKITKAFSIKSNPEKVFPWSCFWLFFPQLYWDIIDIYHCVSLGYIMCRFDALMYCRLVTTTALANMTPLCHIITISFLWWEHLTLLATFECIIQYH